MLHTVGSVKKKYTFQMTASQQLFHFLLSKIKKDEDARKTLRVWEQFCGKIVIIILLSEDPQEWYHPGTYMINSEERD